MEVVLSAFPVSAVPQPDALSMDGLGASLFDASEDCVKILSLDGRLLDMNANGICLMEIDDFAALRGTSWSSMWPEAARPLIEAAVEAGGRGDRGKVVADCPTAKGVMKSWEVVVWPVLDNTGAPFRLVSISRDVTERLAAERERALLTRELAHRIKNMFAVVDGLIAMSARSDRTAASFASRLRERLAGLGRAIAYVAPDGARTSIPASEPSLHGLLREVLDPYAPFDGEVAPVALTGADCALLTAAITPLALVANELATNALKYGSLKNPGGRVLIQTRIERNELQLKWTETGATAVPGGGAGPTHQGFGAHLLENAIVRQLGGRLRRDWTPDGLTVEMTVPLAHIAGV